MHLCRRGGHAYGEVCVIGSEMSGGIEDVSIWDCDMSLSRCGIEIKVTKKRGAPVPPVFNFCSFKRVYVAGVYPQNGSEMVPCEAIELKGFDSSGHELRNGVFEDIVLGETGSGDGQIIMLKMVPHWRQ